MGECQFERETCQNNLLFRQSKNATFFLKNAVKISSMLNVDNFFCPVYSVIVQNIKLFNEKLFIIGKSNIPS